MPFLRLFLTFAFSALPPLLQMPRCPRPDRLAAVGTFHSVCVSMCKCACACVCVSVSMHVHVGSCVSVPICSVRMCEQVCARVDLRVSVPVHAYSTRTVGCPSPGDFRCCKPCPGATPPPDSASVYVSGTLHSPPLTFYLLPSYHWRWGGRSCRWGGGKRSPEAAARREGARPCLAQE